MYYLEYSKIFGLFIQKKNPGRHPQAFQVRFTAVTDRRNILFFANNILLNKKLSRCQCFQVPQDSQVAICKQ